MRFLALVEIRFPITNSSLKLLTGLCLKKEKEAHDDSRVILSLFVPKTISIPSFCSSTSFGIRGTRLSRLNREQKYRSSGMLHSKTILRGFSHALCLKNLLSSCRMNRIAAWTKQITFSGTNLRLLMNSEIP